ncbi:MAG: hypothetical protein PHH37_10555 [Paludibacter sp.]|nr:hypothetical protein [Paludibacter sp.]
MKKVCIISILFLIIPVGLLAGNKPEHFDVFSYGINNQGTMIELKFEKGKEHNHPLFAVWLADEHGKFIQTLYVSKSIGKGIFEHSSRSTGHWQPGEIQRPAALPYWVHQRGVVNEYGTYNPTSKQPVVDAYSGATPQASFILYLKTEKTLSGKYKIFLELNQSWDWNEYWYNNKFSDDKEYKTSSQPALVYEADINTEKLSEVEMKPAGHSHYSGKDGSLDTDLTTLTTALKIARSITVKLK